MTTYKITSIQLFDYAEQIPVSETDFETIYSYSANIIINDEFVVQVHGNKDESAVDGICDSSDCCWGSEEKQDWACENIDGNELIEYLEKNEGFENNIGWLADQPETEDMNPENIIYRAE